jgi:ATP-dependent exoDNAse (exonuclease V) alpha subunit
MNNIIEATILNGKIKGKDVRYVVRVKRLQFPVRLAFAMTINKAQGHRYKCVN